MEDGSDVVSCNGLWMKNTNDALKKLCFGNPVCVMVVIFVEKPLLFPYYFLSFFCSKFLLFRFKLMLWVEKTSACVCVCVWARALWWIKNK